MNRFPSKLLNIGLWANVIEWYEFLVYAHLSSIIAQLFFKSQSPISGLIQTFALFALSYLIRPLGSLFFGYFSEKRGRKTSLHLSLMMMSVPTILIGCLPPYASIGLFSTFCLLVLRLIQGFAAGGELPNIASYVFERSHLQQRTLLLCVACRSPTVGSMLGSLVASLLFIFCDEQTILNWAWRLPFLLAIPLTIYIYSIRKHIEDLPKEELIAKARNTQPFKTLFQKEKFALLKACILYNFSVTVGGYILFMWLPFYFTHFLGYPQHIAHPLNTVMLGLSIPISLWAAWVSRFIGVARILQISIILNILLVYPLFKLMQMHIVLYFSVFSLVALISCISGVIFEVVGSLFKEARILGMGISLTFPTILGGLTPVLLTTVLHKTGWLMFPAFYCIALGLLALPAALTLKNKPIIGS